MPYRGVFVFGDSLVDAGNALALAETVDDLPFSSLPDGAPTADKGYYDGRFTNGLTFADLVSNKFLGVVTEPVYPFGFSDPLLGISYPFASDPDGNNLNFAYGGAQIRKGGESVPDLDDQTDAFRDAVDGNADPGALYLFTIGGNDVRDLVPRGGAIATYTTALYRMQDAADELIEEIQQLMAIGAVNIVVTGIPDVGLIPNYNGLSDEAARREAANDYSVMLDNMIRTQLEALQGANPSAQITYVSLMAATTAHLANLELLYLNAQLYPINESKILFFDDVHPTAQAHALLASSILDSLAGQVAGEDLPDFDPDYLALASVGTAGEIDRLTISLAAGASYTFEMLGVSSGSGLLADPILRVYGPNGDLLSSNDDGGLGLDAFLTLTAAAAGDYAIELTGVGSLSGSYRFQASGDTAGDNVYYVSHANALILERPGEGFDTVLASTSLTLAASASIEHLATTNDAAKALINLTGNNYGQTIMGNAGANTINGKGGNDNLWGLAGKDRFAFTDELSIGNVDTIFDFNPRDDTILLDDAIFSGLAFGVLPKGALQTGTAARQADDRIIYDSLSGRLYFDADGTGPIEQVHFATLMGGALRLTEADFQTI